MFDDDKIPVRVCVAPDRWRPPRLGRHLRPAAGRSDLSNLRQSSSNFAARATCGSGPVARALTSAARTRCSPSKTVSPPSTALNQSCPGYLPSRCGARFGPSRGSHLTAGRSREEGVTIRARTTITAPGRRPGRVRIVAAGGCRRRVDHPADVICPSAARDQLQFSRAGSFQDTAADSRRCRPGISGAAKRFAVAYMITDATGRVVESQAVTEQMAPATAGVPSPLAFAEHALPPVITSEAGCSRGKQSRQRRAPIHVSLVDAGALKLSDLTVGGPLPSGGEPTRPTVDYTVHFGVVHGFLERTDQVRQPQPCGTKLLATSNRPRC